MRITFLLTFAVFLLSSCKYATNDDGSREMEFVLVDSLVFDELETLIILDYDHDKELYLTVKKLSMEGKYSLINSGGEKVAENFLSEGPDAFGLVLHRAGFVGDEIMFVSDQTIFMYDLDLKQLRKFPFTQESRVKLIHFTLDFLSTYSMDGQVMAVANLSDSYLQPYPEDYYDTLNLAHLVNPLTGEVTKGGKLDQSSKLTHGRFFPFMDKPVYFSDKNSNYISAIFSGDSVLYQLDPRKGFEAANKISFNRLSPDNILDVPMSQASYTTVKQHRSENASLGGAFKNILGKGDKFIVEYQTGADPEVYWEKPTPENLDAIKNSRKLYYYPIEDGKTVAPPIAWERPGKLILNVGENRFLQYADQAEIHDFEKDYQCYYIYELKEREG
ncbi:hypothetical protein [Litoribacter populi]|uniref:hypothetical protein n=1 Tax=Litoribacter populi TaxID=2598460 RepID=UPI00117C854B|nr:hypothetical protein [Litoribacter populi]